MIVEGIQKNMGVERAKGPEPAAAEVQRHLHQAISLVHFVYLKPS
jgi:hypothetical protein